MTFLRHITTCAAAGLALAASVPSLAQGAADAARARLAILASRAPLALSGDGAWRLHVDAHDLLHRVFLADPSRESRVQLPPGVQALAASADGRRLVLSTHRQCIGRVDFGANDGDAPSVAWRPIVTARDGTPLQPATGPWVAAMPADCGAHEPAPPVAISSDGRWIATPDDIIDAATNAVVASLPSDAGQVLRLQFVDHDTRLLLVRAQFGDSPGANSLGFSTWDLASKALVNDVEVAGSALATPASPLVDVSARTGVLSWIDERARDRAQAAGGTAPLELMQVAPGACGATPRVRTRVGDDVGPGFAVDPSGRWLAAVRLLDANVDAADWGQGLRSELVVRDLAGGRVLARTPSRFLLAGLVASPDGQVVMAAGGRAIDPVSGDAVADSTPTPDAEQQVRIDLAEALAALPRDAVVASAPGVCREAGEAPGARAQARAEHPLALAWSHDLGADALATPLPDGATCFDPAAPPASFHTADGGLWFDLGAQVVRIDPATGAVVKSLPTPRRKGVCSVVSPSGTGFFNVSGDTLTWRPLAAATDAGRRRIVDRRAGWLATLAPVSGETVQVAWRAASADARADAASGGRVVAAYDATGKRLRESDANDRARALAPCVDTRGAPIAIGYDWRAGPFGSWRGMTCGPLPGAARLIWWSGATIAPRAPGVSLPGRLSAIDGAIGVVADGTQLHVVNLALQREFAQVMLPNGSANSVNWVGVMANRRLVLVQAMSADGHAWLQAYAWP